MKKFIRLGIIVVVILAIVAGIVVTVVLNNRKTVRREEVITDETVSGDLSIRLWEGGYGDQWLVNVKNGFTAKYPNVNIDIKSSTERMVVFGEIVSGTNTQYDLYFTDSVLYDYLDYLEPLNDIFTSTWSGETASVESKIEDVYLDAYKTGDNYFFIPAYTGIYGFVYNTNYISEDAVPVTTDKLTELCAELKLSGIKAIGYSGEAGVNYWNYAYSTWFAQYEGLNAYQQMQIGRTINSAGEAVIDPASAYMTGGLEAMQVCEDLLWYENGYSDPQGTGKQFITAQREFLQGDFAMMYNGSWMMNEMRRHIGEGMEHDFKMMRVPVISSIVDKCPSIDGATPEAKDDELEALIHAIDAGVTDLDGEGYSVTQADYDRVKEARQLVYGAGEMSSAVITKTAQNKNLAKLFLRYMYSDEGIRLHASAMQGCTLPIKDTSIFQGEENIDYEMEFYETAYDIMFSSNRFFNNNRDAAVEVYCTATNAADSIEKQFGSQSAADRTRASASFQAKKELWTADDDDKYWQEMIAQGYVTEKP